MPDPIINNEQDTNEQPTKSSIEQIYDAINDVLGGTDPQQMLCLTIPGTVLDKESYVYDTRFEKPIKVAANESRLTNKLFDVTKVAGSDNGRQLSSQFVSALDTLTPKVNTKLMEAKDQIREMLKMPVTYKLEDGTAVEGTLQEAFYYMYGEYVKEKQIWADKQNEKKTELEDKYPGKSDEARLQREEEFLNWYQTVAETYLLQIQVKRGKILAFFSPNDMKILEGILSSGSGAELEEAREQVENAKKFDPDGGYVYPVTLQPADWFESLNSSMGFIDLLQSSDAYAMQYSTLQSKRRAITRKISMFEMRNKSESLQSALKALKDAETAMAESEKDLTATYAKGANIVINGIVDLLPTTGENVNTTANQEANKLLLDTFANQLDLKGLLSPESLSKFNDAYIQSDASTNDYVNASKNLAACARELIDSKSSDYTAELKDSYIQLETINEEIEDVKSKLKMALAKESENDPNVTMFPDAYEKRFQEILIHTDMSRATSSTSKSSSSTSSSGRVGFLFGGYKSESGSSSSVDATALASSKMTIDIGFLATKVSIVRNWFNPGVFLLSKDMFRSSSTKISDGSKDADAQKNNLFPCYPTAFVIAKDVTIRFSSEDTKDSSIKTALESHASRGGGFLGFSGRKSTSSSSSSSNTSSSSDSKGVTIKIPGPQIIGYYLQIVPADNSTPIDTTNQRNMDVSILDFVNHYKEVYNNNL